MQIKPPKIYVAGHNGLVRFAIVCSLNQSAVREFLEEERPDQIYLCAAKVWGNSC